MLDPTLINLALPPQAASARSRELASRAAIHREIEIRARLERPARLSPIAAIRARAAAIAFPAPRPPYGRPAARAELPALPY